MLSLNFGAFIHTEILIDTLYSFFCVLSLALLIQMLQCFEGSTIYTPGVFISDDMGGRGMWSLLAIVHFIVKVAASVTTGRHNNAVKMIRSSSQPFAFTPVDFW